MPKKLMFIVGTRPEFIKLAPVILLAKKSPSDFEVQVVSTGQHHDMFNQMLEVFDLTIDFELKVMQHDQKITGLTTSLIEKLSPLIENKLPDYIIVQGDTTTTFVGSLVAFYHRIPVAHVEAGLRTHDKYQPFPEEINRRLTSQIADFHFAPTEDTKIHLLQSGISENRIWVTGNTVIDAMLLTLEKIQHLRKGLEKEKIILVTAHRRENHGKPLEKVCKAILRLQNDFPDLKFLFPVHKSPKVREVVFNFLNHQPRISLIDPLNYLDFILAMDRSYIILSDSGGIQEEASILKKPVLILRNTTERPEGVRAGVTKLVGLDPERIYREVSNLIQNEEVYREMTHGRNPFGDGHASVRILDVLKSDDY